MATFEAKVYKLTIEEHPNADALELAVVGDYRSIVRKGQFKTGDLGVYIPEAAILPNWLIAELGLEGRLAGSLHNRVKAVKLRGILSQGLVYPVYVDKHPTDYFIRGKEDCDREYVGANDVVTDFLGITKYEPVIPSCMNGEVFNAFGMTLKYDIENIKKYPDVIKEGEEVVVTEKIHGTWCCFGYHPDAPHTIVTSKGLSDKGLAFKFNEENERNLYIRALNGTCKLAGWNGEHEDIVRRAQGFWGATEPFYILGEVYGAGVQDLHYGAKQPQFRVFDIYFGQPGEGRYADAHTLSAFCQALEVDMVPVVYTGPFSKEMLEEVTDGKETVSGTEDNIREGVVINPDFERRDPELGRVVLKSVSEKYLLRKNGTEYN